MSQLLQAEIGDKEEWEDWYLLWADYLLQYNKTFKHFAPFLLLNIHVPHTHSSYASINHLPLLPLHFFLPLSFNPFSSPRQNIDGMEE